MIRITGNRLHRRRVVRIRYDERDDSMRFDERNPKTRLHALRNDRRQGLGQATVAPGKCFRLYTKWLFTQRAQ